MADNDYGIIKPVETLQNVPALSPAKRREQRKSRRQPPNQEKGEDEPSSFEEQVGGAEANAGETEEHSLDYCA
jgi:hypothetical protein